MTASDPLQLLEELLDQLPEAVEHRRLGDSLARAAAALTSADRQIERVEALLGLAVDLGFGLTGAQEEILEAARGEALEVGRGLEAATTPAALEKAVDGFTRDLAPALANLDRSVRQHWSAVIAEQFQPLIAIGELLTRIDADSDLGARLASCGRAAQAAATSLSGRSLRDRVRELLQERQRLQERRREELGEGDVVAFVNALAENRATLAMVTESVRSWLASNQALEKLRVSPSA